MLGHQSHDLGLNRLSRDKMAAISHTMFYMHFVDDKFCISITVISLKVVPNGLIDKNPSFR